MIRKHQEGNHGLSGSRKKIMKAYYYLCPLLYPLLVNEALAD